MRNTISELYSHFKKNSLISIDSRNVPENSIFFALKGDSFNGNEFAESALAKGAYLAVIDETEFAKDDRYFLVDDVLGTLQKLSLWHRNVLKIPVIGITGSNGKTTTKELINAVLSTQFNCLATKGNFNNHIGVPLTLLSIDEKKEIAIVEMGANHIGEIDQLCQLSCPTHGIITNIGKAHLEGFINFDNIIKTKIALYEYVQKNGKCVFVNNDDELLMEKSRGIERMTYSNNKFGNVKAEVLSSEPFMAFKWNETNIQTNLFGHYNIYNVLAAITIGQYFGISNDNIINAISSYTPQNNRSQVIKTASNTIIMDAYNANPTSMTAAVKSFAQLSASDKIVVLGDMLELGTEKEAEHEKIIELLKENKFKEVFLVGDIFSSVNNNAFRSFKNAVSLKIFFDENPPLNKTILIKASRGIKLEVITQSL